LPITPFLLDEASSLKPSEFEVAFISEGVRYQYGFAATTQRIVEEWLLAYPSGKAQRWIERQYDEQTQSHCWGSMGKLTGKKQLWQEATRPNALFLSTAMQLNSQQLNPVFSWFANNLHVTGFGRWHPGFSIKNCEKDKTKQRVVTFLKAADVNIDDIELEKEKFNPQNLPDDMPEEIKRRLEEFKDKSIVQVKTVHTLETGRKVLFDLENESDGTQKIFALSVPCLDTLENGHVLVIDELHDNLHPLMVKFLVSLFHSQETNPNNAQLIFTTHDTSILNQEVFRRDQIWFCEKGRDQNTTVYPLTDFSPRKSVENLERGYLTGRYGALPYLTSVKSAMAG
jgi:AAA15 family ATPase/GTPase